MVDLSGLEGLTGRGGDINDKVAFLRDILPDYIEEGYSYAQSLRDLRANDFSISTNLFYLVRRQIEGLSNEGTAIRNLPNDYFPDINDLGLNPDRQDRAFKFIYRAVGVDPETGEERYQNFSLQMDSFSNIGELKDQGISYLAEKYPEFADYTNRIELYYGLRAQ